MAHLTTSNKSRNFIFGKLNYVRQILAHSMLQFSRILVPSILYILSTCTEDLLSYGLCVYALVYVFLSSSSYKKLFQGVVYNLSSFTRQFVYLWYLSHLSQFGDYSCNPSVQESIRYQHSNSCSDRIVSSNKVSPLQKKAKLNTEPVDCHDLWYTKLPLLPGVYSSVDVSSSQFLGLIFGGAWTAFYHLTQESLKKRILSATSSAFCVRKNVIGLSIRGSCKVLLLDALPS